jgi:aminopeptidase N
MKNIIEQEQQHYNFISKAKIIGSATDKSFDITYERLEFNIHPNVWAIQGKITFQFKVLQQPFTFLILDCSDSLVVDSVYYHQSNNLFHRAKDQLIVDLFSNISLNTTDSITVFYHGKPVGKNGFGAFKQLTHNGNGIIWTLSEPYGAGDWMPCKQSLNDKIDSIDIFISAPDSFISVSNGLRKTITNSNGFNTTHWKHRYPIATYLIAIACTNYKEYNDYVINGNDSLLIQNFVYPEDLKIAKSSTPFLLNVIKFYENKFGKYPFRNEKYGQAQFGWGGGMEHQTQTFVSNFNFGLLAHELAHQWFGDKATCSSWTDIWLNEGFATYCAALADECCGEYQNWLGWKWGSYQTLIDAEAGSVYCDDTTSVARIFNGDYSYLKGAWVLHQLRYQMGDTLFFKAIKNYIQSPAIAYGYTNTEILKQNIEQVWDKNVNTYFKIWYQGKEIPELKIKWYQNTENKLSVKIQFISNQNDELFWAMKLPFRISKYIDGGILKDSLIYFNFTSNNQTFEINLPEKIDIVYFDPECWFLVRKDVQHTPEAGFNTNAPIQIFPNPVHDFIYFNQQQYHITQFKFYDVMGKMVYQTNENSTFISSNFSNTIGRLDISFLHNGIYFVNIINAENNTIQKLIKF